MLFVESYLFLKIFFNDFIEPVLLANDLFLAIQYDQYK